MNEEEENKQADSGDEVTKLAANHVNITHNEILAMGPDKAMEIIRKLSGSVLRQNER
jgi:predicted small metal-binding protein